MGSGERAIFIQHDVPSAEADQHFAASSCTSGCGVIVDGGITIA